MTTEQLLSPQYKVLAPYPHSPYLVGDTLKGNDDEVHLTTTSYYNEGEFKEQDNYFPWNILPVMPHLFQRVTALTGEELSITPEGVKRRRYEKR